MKNLHLIISSIIVIPIGIIYGFMPNFLFDVTVNSIDETNIFKAIMGLYLAFASIWILGIFNSSYWKSATIINMIFMLGLGFGRIISLLFDGIPCNLFVLGTFGELVLGFYGMYLLKKKSDNI